MATLFCLNADDCTMYVYKDIYSCCCLPFLRHYLHSSLFLHPTSSRPPPLHLQNLLGLPLFLLPIELQTVILWIHLVLSALLTWLYYLVVFRKSYSCVIYLISKNSGSPTKLPLKLYAIPCTTRQFFIFVFLKIVLSRLFLVNYRWPIISLYKIIEFWVITISLTDWCETYTQHVSRY